MPASSAGQATRPTTDYQAGPRFSSSDQLEKGVSFEVCRPAQLLAEHGVGLAQRSRYAPQPRLISAFINHTLQSLTLFVHYLSILRVARPPTTEWY